MQTFRACARARPTRLFLPTARGFSSAPNNPPVLPWFLEEEPVPHSFVARPNPPHLRPKPDRPPVPENAPQPLKQLHAELSESPHLEQSTLVVSQPLAPPMGPALPLRMPQGRRRRGGTFAGVSSYDYPGGIWNWVIMAQVKEGTEDRGAIESVVRVIRKTLLTLEPPLPLPPNSKRRMHNGWAMVDAGDFAIHIMSKEAREKYFSTEKWDQW